MVTRKIVDEHPGNIQGLWAALDDNHFEVVVVAPQNRAEATLHRPQIRAGADDDADRGVENSRGRCLGRPGAVGYQGHLRAPFIPFSNRRRLCHHTRALPSSAPDCATPEITGSAPDWRRFGSCGVRSTTSLGVLSGSESTGSPTNRR